MRYVEGKGKTPEEALENALKKAGVTNLNEVKYEVVKDGMQGGMALVRVYTDTPELDLIEQTVKEFFDKMGCKAEIEVMPKRIKYYVNIKTHRYDSLLIGRNGKTLEALDYLLNLLIRRRGYNGRVEIDVSGYKERKRQFLINKALAIARQVKETGREMRMDGLNQREMKLVRNVLKKDKDVKAFTVKRGDEKVLIIAPAA